MDGGQIFLLVLCIAVGYGLIDSLHYWFIRRRISQTIRQTEQQITNANVTLGEYTSRSDVDPRYEVHMEEVHEDIERLVEYLKSQQYKSTQHTGWIASIAAWYYQARFPQEQQRKMLADHKVDVKFGRVHPTEHPLSNKDDTQ